MSETDSLKTESELVTRSSWWQIFSVFLRLGLTSFGGPTAHIGYFREALVETRNWLTDQAYADLVALCQFLPGPASSQVGFAIGLKRGGWFGGLAAWLGFTMPSAIVLTVFGLTVTRWGGMADGSWMRGLQIAAVVVIAKAVYSMAQSLCPDRLRATLAIAAAAVVLALPGTGAQVGVILVGGLIGWWRISSKHFDVAADLENAQNPASRIGWVSLILFFVLLFGLPPLAATSGSEALMAISGFYRTGSLVFGGGHVVLPLLQAETVAPGFVSQEHFLAGYGAAQAVPGPLFTFAAYLGSVMSPGGAPLLMAMLCLVAVFLPSFLLVGGLLPLWEKMRTVTALRRALAGTNAAVVGLLGAALYRPAWTGSISGVDDFIFLLGVAALLLVWKWPVWLVVILAGLAGAVFL